MLVAVVLWHAFCLVSAVGSSTDPTVIFQSNFTEPSWVAIYHIPVLIAIPLPGRYGATRMMAFAEARECGRNGSTSCDPGLAPDGAPKGLAFRYSDWSSNATSSNGGWVPALGTAPRFLHRDSHDSCCLNLGAAVFDAVKGVIHLHFVVGVHSKRGEQVLLSSRDYGITWEKSNTYAAQLERAGLYVDGAPAFAPGPGLGVQLMAATKARHRMLVCGQGKARMSSVCIASDDHGASWVSAGVAQIGNSTLPSEASVVELRNGSVLMNTRNSCHRLPAPQTCCWGDGCYDKEGVPHCHGPKTCDHAHDHRHTRLLMWSHDGGETFSAPEWCAKLPDPDCEGSMVADIDTGDILFSNNRNGTIGNRDNMTVYRASALTGGICDDWNVLHRVNVGPAGYSCIASMDGGRLGILYEHAWSARAAAVNDRDRTNIVFSLLPT